MDPIKTLVDDIEFERPGPVRRALKRCLFNPIANYAPAGVLRALLRFAKSELAEANWEEPGGWRSMVISYDGKPRQIADKILIGAGTVPMALRNRRKLAAKVLAALIDQAANDPVHALCVGAGPGRIIMDAMHQTKRRVLATLVDLNTEPFDHGRRMARNEGLENRIRFVHCDVRKGIHSLLDHAPDVVKMIGICEYLSDDQIKDIASSVHDVMPPGAPIVFNSISRDHGTDRFLRRVLGLHMIYRSPAQLERLMRTAGFENFSALAEPLGVYQVIVGRKSAESGDLAGEGTR